MNCPKSGLLLAAVLAAAPAAAADDIFLKLDGIDGEVAVSGHQREIDILSYTQTMSGPFARSAPGSGAAGKTVCGAVTVMKYVDMSSPDLVLNAANGRHIPRAVFTFRKPGEKGPEYYKVTLEDVIILEVEQTNSKLNFPNPAPPKAIEKVSLTGRRFHFEYTATMADGRTGGKPKAGWDCVAASKA